MENKGIDSHCHLEYLKKDIDDVLKEAREKLDGIITSAADPADMDFVLDTAEKNKGFVFAALGFHPERIRKYKQAQIDDYIELIKRNKDAIAAVGECGLDYNWNKEKAEQELTKSIFLQFIELSNEINKPIVVHTRNGAENAYPDVFRLLENKKGAVILHCFSGSESNLKEALSKKYWISFATNIARSDKHKRLAKETPLESMLLETDSPWLDPFSNERTNRPWNIIYSAGIIANIKKVTKEEILEKTTINARKAFSI